MKQLNIVGLVIQGEEEPTTREEMENTHFLPLFSERNKEFIGLMAEDIEEGMSPPVRKEWSKFIRTFNGRGIVDMFLSKKLYKWSKFRNFEKVMRVTKPYIAIAKKIHRRELCSTSGMHLYITAGLIRYYNRA